MGLTIFISNSFAKAIINNRFIHVDVNEILFNESSENSKKVQ